MINNPKIIEHIKQSINKISKKDLKYSISLVNLIDYVKEDRKMRKFHTETDFEKFCESHCEDIENMLDYIDELKSINKTKISKEVIENKIKELKSKDYEIIHTPMGTTTKYYDIIKILESLLDEVK